MVCGSVVFAYPSAYYLVTYFRNALRLFVGPVWQCADNDCATASLSRPGCFLSAPRFARTGTRVSGSNAVLVEASGQSESNILQAEIATPMSTTGPEDHAARSGPSLSNVLDVTLRDGGYLNQWRFSAEEIAAVLRWLASHGIRRAEVGFLRASEDSTSSVNGCPEPFLQRLAREHPAMRLVAMLNPGDARWREAIEGKLEYLSLVRLTCTAELVERALTIAEAIRGVPAAPEVSVNLICISSYSHDEVADLLRIVDRSRAVDYLYFADSRGALAPSEIAPLVALAKRHCHQSLGFHAHDTRGNAVENSRVAYANGCDLVDVSLNGFGLAGGNTPFAGFLTATGLADASIDARTRAFCARCLSLRHAAGDDRALFAALAAKNVDPIWSDALRERWQSQLQRLMDRLPRRVYKSLDEVLDALQNLPRSPRPPPVCRPNAPDGRANHLVHGPQMQRRSATIE